MADPVPVTKTDEQWRRELTPEQYQVLRRKGTEAPFSGEYYLTHDHGIYRCAACGAPLFRSEDKFDSECGWPSFAKPISPDAIKTQVDMSYGMVRTEVMCARCGSHLGHVFDDGPIQLGGDRFCINSVSMKLARDKGPTTNEAPDKKK